MVRYFNSSESNVCIHFVFLNLVCFLFFSFFFLGEYKKIVVSSLINKCTFQLCVVQVLAS